MNWYLRDLWMNIRYWLGWKLIDLGERIAHRRKA